MESVSNSSQAKERTPRLRLGQALLWKAALFWLVWEEMEEMEELLKLQWILPALPAESQHLALK